MIIIKTNQSFNMNKKTLTSVAVILGAIFVILAVVYWFVPAGNLPSILPGYSAGSTQIHVKHGIASFLLALALFAFAWFKSGEQLPQ